MSDAATETVPADVPQSQADWKARIASASGKDLLKLVQRDKPRANRVLSGFRANEQAIKNPVVVTRVVEEAMKQPGFASELAATLLPVPSPSAPIEKEDNVTPELATASEGVAGNTAVAVPDVAETKKDPKLREQIEKQRAALKEKEARIAELERDAAQSKREIAAARADLESARRAKADAEADAANLRRRAERDEKRVKSPEPVPATKPVAAHVTQTTNPQHTNAATPLEESLRRLVRRGKYPTVAEVCREAISGGGVKEAPALVRGAVYALYAAALYGIGEPDRAADQDNRAAEAYLDAGAVTEATDAFTRLLNQPTLLRSTLADDATLLRRLVALAERDNKIGDITTTFARVRIVSPQGFSLLLSSLTRKLGKRGAEIAASLTQLAKDQSGAGGVGADESVTLPGTALPPLSPRKLADAVETGEHRFVLRVRDVFAQMRSTGDQNQMAMVDSLLVAVGELSRIAVCHTQPRPDSRRGAPW